MSEDKANSTLSTQSDWDITCSQWVPNQNYSKTGKISLLAFFSVSTGEMSLFAWGSFGSFTMKGKAIVPAMSLNI